MCSALAFSSNQTAPLSPNVISTRRRAHFPEDTRGLCGRHEINDWKIGQLCGFGLVGNDDIRTLQDFARERVSAGGGIQNGEGSGIVSDA